MTTRAGALKHLLTTVIGKTEQDKSYVCVVDHHQSGSFIDFSRLTIDDFKDDFPYMAAGAMGSVQVRLATAECNLLVDLQGFIRLNSQVIGFDWTGVTENDFEDYRNNLIGAPTSTTGTAVPQPSQASTTTSVSAVHQMAMKHQYSDYKEITKRHFFTSWNKELKVTAITHNCSNPLDQGYVPVTQEEEDIFEIDQAFMMGVFLNKIKYPSGQERPANP